LLRYVIPYVRNSEWSSCDPAPLATHGPVGYLGLLPRLTLTYVGKDSQARSDGGLFSLPVESGFVLPVAMN
jgi:hypothetical protein